MNGHRFRTFAGFGFSFLAIVSGLVWYASRDRTPSGQGVVFGEVIERPSQPAALVVTGNERALGWLTPDGAVTQLNALNGRTVLSADELTDGTIIAAEQKGSQSVFSIINQGKESFLFSARYPVEHLAFSDRIQFASFTVSEDGESDDVYVVNTETRKATRLSEDVRSFAWMTAPFGLAVLDAAGGLWLHGANSSGDFDPPVLIQDGIDAFCTLGPTLLLLRHDDSGSHLLRLDLVTGETTLVSDESFSIDDRISLIPSGDGNTFAVVARAADGQSGFVEIRRSENVPQRFPVLPSAIVWVTDQTVFVQGSDGNAATVFRYSVTNEQHDVLTLPAMTRLLQ